MSLKNEADAQNATCWSQEFQIFTVYCLLQRRMFGEDHGMLASGPDLKIHQTDLSVGLKLGEFPEESLFLASLKAALWGASFS